MPQYRSPPPPGLRRLLWGWQIKFEATFGLAMMETWEKVLIISVFTSITLVFWLSVFAYYPGHLAYLSRRFSYYVFDDENVDLSLVFREWVIRQLRKGWDGVKLVGGKGIAGGATSKGAEL